MGNITKKIASVVFSTTAAALITGFAVVVPVAHAQSTSDLQAQINALLQQISALQAKLAAQGDSSSSAACNFTHDLTVGAKGNDVKCLQAYLSVSPTSGYFGPLTKAAVAKWQASNGLSPAAGYFGAKSRAKYASLVAAPAPAPAPGPTPGPVAMGSGLTATLTSDQPPSGLFGQSFASRPFTKIALSASADGDVTVKSLTVERQGQGQDAAFSGVIALDETGIRLGDSKTFGSDHRLKLTSPIMIKAGQTRTITLAGDSPSNQTSYNGQLVQLALVGIDAGSANVNATFPLVGNAMTVNNTLTIGSLKLDRGPSDPGSSNTKEIGTVGYIFASLKMTAGSAEDVLIKAINWNQSGSAAVTDTANLQTYVDGVAYPMTVSLDGKYYTANFGAGIKILKGLNKEFYVKGDVVGGSNRTVNFDLYRYADIKVTGTTYGYDILPSNAAEVAASADDGNFHSSQPNWDGFKATIGAGTVQVQNATAVGSQNIAINLADQPLGGFIADVKGEDITVGGMNFDLSTVVSSTGSRTVGTNDITNITLVDENGKVVAGPVDGVAGGTKAAKFTDTVTLKVGRHAYTVKGKLSTNFQNNDTVAASTTPSGWTTVKGVTSAVTITPTPSSAVTMSTMTVKAAALTVTLSPDTQVTSDASSTAQTVVAGTSGYTFTKYILDASGSGEDIKITSMALRLRLYAGGSATDITNCQLFDGNLPNLGGTPGTPLNTGTNIVNPASTKANGDTLTFTLDSPYTIPKGTVKTASIRCNLISGAASGRQYGWGLRSTTSDISATGVTSGTSVTPTMTADNGRVITAVTSGTLAVALDTGSTPAPKWVQAGTTDNPATVLRLTSSNEDVRVDSLYLKMGTSTTNIPDATIGNASNTPNDLAKVTVWTGAYPGTAKVGEAVFTSTDYATVTLSGVTVPKDQQVLLTVRVDTAAIGTGLAARPGHDLMINYDANGSSDKTNTGAVGVGLSSGVTIAGGGSVTAANDMRLARAYPSVTKLAHPSGKFSNASSQTLYRFKVSAPAGTNGVGLYHMTFEVSTSTTQGCDNSQSAGHTCNFTVTNFKLYCYSDSGFSVPSCNAFDNSGLLNQGGLANASVDRLQQYGAAPAALSNPARVGIYFNPTDSTGGSTKEGVRIAAGDTKYFALLADIANASSTPNIAIKMDGDAQFNTLAAPATPATAGTGNDLTQVGDNWLTGRYVFATTAANLDIAARDRDFIWSGNSTNTTQSVNDYDWFNGYLIPGLSNSDTGITDTLGLQ